MFIKFIDHLYEFIFFDHSAHHIRGTAPGRLIKVAVVQHITLFEVFPGEPFSQVEKPFDHIAATGYIPDFFGSELKAGVIVEYLRPVFKVRQCGAEEGGVIFAIPRQSTAM